MLAVCAEPPAPGPAGRSLSPYSTRTAPIGTPSACAVTWACAVAAPMPISWKAHRTSTEPSAASRTVTFAGNCQAGWYADATPMPTSHRPSRIEPGSGVRADQPNRSAPTAYASRSLRWENRLPSNGLRSGSLRIRSSIGSRSSR